MYSVMLPATLLGAALTSAAVTSAAITAAEAGSPVTAAIATSSAATTSATASLTLAVLAVLLAWPVPVLLARAHWPTRSPGAALLLWQAIALSGGLSMIGSLTTFGLIPFHSGIIGGMLDLPAVLLGGPLPVDVGLIHVFALSSALLLLVHLLLNLGLTIIRTERQRRRHRSLVDLLSTPLLGQPGTLILDSPAPVAYCLPGARTVTVLSEGLVSLLDPAQLEAVIAHEQAHLRQRHHILLVAFESWRGSLPWFPIATRAQVAVSLLVEMLADDQSRRSTDNTTLAEAIALVGSAETPSVARRGAAAGTGGTGRADSGAAGTEAAGTGAGSGSGASSSSAAGVPVGAAPAPAVSGVTANPLARALRVEQMRTATEVSNESLALSVDPVVIRVRRLIHPQPQLTLAARSGVLALAALLLAFPAAVLFVA